MTLTAVAGVIVLAGCGGTRQDAHEPNGTFSVQVLKAAFPTTQSIAHHARFVLTVRNSGSAAVPDLAVSFDGFAYRSAQVGLSNPSRPVWIVDAAPPGGDTAYTATWALGRLPPGQSRTFVWRVTPVVAGMHSVHYTVAAGLNGKAHAQLANGQLPEGTFMVDVAGAPAQTHVDPNTGQVVPGPPPQSAP